MGLPKHSADKTHLVRGPICTENYYACGKETVAAVSSDAYSINKPKGSSGATFVMSESDLDNLFKIDTSTADAYSGCGRASYALYQSDYTTAYTDTTYVTYTAGTGLAFKIDIDVNPA